MMISKIRFVRQNDRHDDSWTVKESTCINASCHLGINDTDPISELSVAGKISITSESITPIAPADGHGWLYTKSDGKFIGNLTMLPRPTNRWRWCRNRSIQDHISCRSIRCCGRYVQPIRLILAVGSNAIITRRRWRSNYYLSPQGQ